MRNAPRSSVAASSSSLLGDTPTRDYSRKLQLFNAFAEPEIRKLIAALGLRPGMRVLDAGCGTGEALEWLQEMVNPAGSVVGVDLSRTHVSAARKHLPSPIEILQCDFLSAPFATASFDLVWCANTLNHLSDRIRGLNHLAGLLRPGGRIALAQSSLLPDMYFAWDARLERVTNEAVRQYYRHRYRLDERDLASVRALVGLLRDAKLRNITARTVVIERITPLDAASESYLREAIFRDTWGERLQPYLSEHDYAELGRLCDPRHPEFALLRPDFHFMQSFTLAMAEI
jgi:ubiquinone/menaquinone biosynthesis C-methylase UbiE